jgi:nucleotide-binding universal stress UspA family protein
MYDDLLVPVDLAHDGSSRKSVLTAVEYAKAFNSTIHLMAVIPDSGMAMVSQYFSKSAVDKIIESSNDTLREYARKNIPKDVKLKIIVTTGNVYESIINAATKIDVDLIIMSAHRPELKDYLLGPNAARVVRHSDRSVLVVRQ